MAVRATVPILINRISFPAPSITRVLSVAATPLAVTATIPTPGGALVLPTQTPLVVSVTEMEPFIAPAVASHTVAATLKTPLVGGDFMVAVLSESSLVGYWRLNEPSGTIATDLKNGNNGTYTGTPTLGNAGPLTLWANSLGAKIVTGSYVSVPDSTALDVGDIFTIELFVKRTTTGAEHVLVSKQASAWLIAFKSDNTLWLGQEGVPYMWGTTTAFTDTTKWHHIVVTKNGATRHIYVDDVDEALTGSNTTIGNNNSSLLFGRDSGGAAPATDDYLSEIAIYSTALAGATVSTHYANAVTDGLVI